MQVSVRSILPFIFLRRLSLGLLFPLFMGAQPGVPASVPAPAANIAIKPAPSKVDKALRERASQFLQFTVDRAYSKAFELVAPETKDWYLSSGKPQYTSFKIDRIEYSKDYKQATVHTKVMRVLSMNARDVSTDIEVSDLWRFESGKWVWWHDPDVLVTPFGEIKINRKLQPANPPGVSPIPGDTSPAKVQDFGNNLSLEASASKQELLFEEGKPGSDEFAFHNGASGVVDMFVDIVGDYVSFSVEPKQLQLEGGKDVTLKVSYKPSAHPFPAFVRITIQPFERSFQIPLKFKSPAP